MTEILLNDPTIWVFFSFVAFVALAFALGRKKVLGMIDGRIDQIRHQIDSAEAMRREAQSLLDQYRAGIAGAEQEARDIIERAQHQAAELREKAAQEFEATMARRESLLAQRLAQMERSAQDELANYAIDLGVRAATEVLANHLSPDQGKALVDQSISKVGRA